MSLTVYVDKLFIELKTLMVIFMVYLVVENV